MEPHLVSDLKPLVDRKTALIRAWIAEGKLAEVDPRHLMFSIWATTQHYADFDAQVQVLSDSDTDALEGADTFLDQMFRKLLAP
jgi:TetR/AcrR family transcriptional regulator